MRTQFLVAAFLFGACATTLVDVAGPYASRLSASDIQQIRAIVEEGPRSTSTQARIEALHPEKVRVTTLVVQSSGSERLRFIATKHAGKWSAVRDSFEVLQSSGTIVVP